MTLRAGVPRKGPRASEFRFASALRDMLERKCSPHWRYTHLPFGEKRDPLTARKLQLMGVTSGWPDYMFVGPGRICFLELKIAGGVRSKVQSEIAGHLTACGCGYAMTNNFKGAVGILQDWGVLPPGIHVQ